MNVHALKNYIKSNTDLIELILEKSGFYHISDDFAGGTEYRCARKHNGNPTAIRVNKETLKATDFKGRVSGDIITLIEDKMNIGFTKAVDYIASIVKFEDMEQQEYTLPFGGFYKKIKKFRDNNGIELQTYDESILDQYLLTPNKMFLEDGITAPVQQKYKLGFDIVTNRITIPWRDSSGRLIGVMGRINKREVEDYENKYFPIINFPKSKSLFGFSENYREIQEKGTCYVLESEKSPMVLNSKGVHLGLAIGGSNLSEYQANNIKSLFVKRVIVGLDEGLEEEVSFETATKLKMDKFHKNESLYIYDKHNLILPKGSKMSPADLPINDFKMLLRQCLKKV